LVNDTIAAISTPAGEGGIGIVRISGQSAFTIATSLFDCKEKKSSSFPLPRHLYYGHIINRRGEAIDEVLVSFMSAPNTYTREDVVEINCHSGMINLRLVLDNVIDQGARLAEPGEFTKRAFLSGRIDLLQAESIIGIIKSKSEIGAIRAADSLKGDLSQRVSEIRVSLVTARAQIEAGLDYPEEIEDQQGDLRLKVGQELNHVKSKMEEIVRGVERNNLYIEGTTMAIVGRPNVGKSSLLNNLLKQEKAITHELPGTTRDTLEGLVYIGGYPINMVDTAGIQTTEDPVEKKGIERTYRAASTAKILLIVLDGSEKIKELDKSMKNLIKPGQLIIIVINKIDLPQAIKKVEIDKLFPGLPVINISALKNQGVESLEKEIVTALDRYLGQGGENMSLSSVRQENILREALNYIQNATQMLYAEPVELISYELNCAWEKLGEAIGEVASESLLDEIFSQFCLGK